jgi:hypothetical protein
MGFVACVRRCALLALAANLAALPARAVELRELAGWWIAIDEKFPRLWQQGEIAPAEELLQINPDGRVQDRVLNFWAGSAQVCREHKVCSDLPVISQSRLQIAGEKISFQPIIIPNSTPDKLDTGAADAAIRREAITATADWTASLTGGRLTLRRPGTVRVLARIEPARLRRLYAGMQASGFAPAEHWRCYLAHATARDDAFAPLRAAWRGHASAPDFLDRYLGVATYITAIRSTLALPAIDESDEEQRKRLGFNTEEQMVQHFETILRPPRVDDRPRLQAVLDYIDAHTGTTIAYETAAGEAARERARSDAAAAEAARLLRLAREAAAAADAAHAKMTAAAVESETAHRDAVAAAEAAANAAASARQAETVAAARQTAADAAVTAHEAALAAAAGLRNKSDAAARAAEAQKRNSEVADAALAAEEQRLDAALRTMAAQEEKAGAIGRAAAAHHEAFEHTARELADSHAALERGASEAAAALARGRAAARQAAEANTMTAPDPTLEQRALVAEIAMQDALRALAATRDRARAVADAAAAGAALLRLEADVAAQRQARDRAKAVADAEAHARDQAAAEADALAREHAKLADAAGAAAKAAQAALDAANAAHAAHAKAKSEADTAAQQAFRRAEAAQTTGHALAAAQQIEHAANALRDRAKAQSDAAADVAAKAATIARHAADLAGAARAAMDAAAATQPKGEGLVPIAAADIAALAHVIGESEAAKKLFCRGEYAGGPHPAATTASATPVPLSSPARESTPSNVDVPLPLPRPTRR